MCKRKSISKKVSKASILLAALFIIATGALILTVDYFSPNILKQVDRSANIFESAVDSTAKSVVSPAMYRLPKLTDLGAKRLASRYLQGNMLDSEILSENYIAANFSDVINDNSLKLEIVNNSYDCYVYKITDENSSDEWLVGVLLDGNNVGRFVLLEGDEK